MLTCLGSLIMSAWTNLNFAYSLQNALKLALHII